jgi:hypothetical protein
MGGPKSVVSSKLTTCEKRTLPSEPTCPLEQAANEAAKPTRTNGDDLRNVM